VTAVACSPNGKKIISGSFDRTIKIWSIYEKSCLYTLSGHSSGVTSVAYSPCGYKIVSGSYDSSIKIWDV
jgi:WD40 repeat protein